MADYTGDPLLGKEMYERKCPTAFYKKNLRITSRFFNSGSVLFISDKGKREERMMAEEMNMGEVVMVVDDNKEIVYSISELLKYEGYRVIPAYDGMEALNLLEQNPVDLILLDVMMPRLNGLSALMKLREKYRIPVIILSAKTEESDKVSGLVLGADDYVEKPYNPAELMARVKAHLRRYRAWGGELPKEMMIRS